jgi:two-component system, NtrC family, response regulator PilR
MSGVSANPQVAAPAAPAGATGEPHAGGEAATDRAASVAGTRPRVLVVDDEASMRDMLRIVLRREGWDVVVAENGRSAIERLRREQVDVLLSDIRMPDVNGVEVLRAARESNRDVIAFMMTAYASTETAVEAMRLGAVDYFMKPFNMDELRLKVRQHLEAGRLRRENVLLKRTLATRHTFANIIGRSEPMLALFQMIETVARTTSTVLITGESGTGKDLVARAIHWHSLRREHPFVAVNCGGVPETLLESELFGHMRGAFTGADTSKKGLMEVADRGTIFLDEVGEMTTTMQVKLLRVLQDRRFRRLGGTEEMQADLRVVAATNQDLERRVAEGAFREDLYYRINVIPLHLPPLRERREDIPLLAAHFLESFATRMQKPVRGLAQETVERLCSYAWPGNVRELENVIERAVALEPTPVVLPESLPPHVRPGPDAGTSTPAARGLPPVRPLGADELPPGFDLEAHGEEVYRRYMLMALERSGGVQVKAAELLGMSFRSFRYYAKKLNLR